MRLMKLNLNIYLSINLMICEYSIIDANVKTGDVIYDV